MRGHRVLDRGRRAGDRLSSGRLAGENAALKTAVQALRARVSELERLADSDTLTPLPNRRLFERELERAIGRLERYGGSAALLFVDVNGLKGINDFHGHAAGDAALIHVASLLRERLRASDVVARIGGDEFGLILDAIDERAARDKAAALAEEIGATPLGNGIVVAVSVGAAMLAAGEAWQVALKRADADMYRAKRASALEPQS